MTQEEFLKHILTVLEQMDVTYLIVGSYASGILGEPRMTVDVDIVVKLIREDIPVLERAFRMPEFYFDADTARHAMATEGMFNLIHPASGNKADFIVARTDEWGRHQVHNRRRVPVLPGFSAFVGSPEDIIIGKLTYYKEGGSEKHLRDIIGILREKRTKLDDAYIKRWVQEFELSEIWKLILERLQTP